MTNRYSIGFRETRPEAKIPSQVSPCGFGSTGR